MTISATTQGLKPGICTSTTRPVTPFTGMIIYETDTLLAKVWTGSAWVDYPAGKANTASPTFTGTVVLPSTTSIGTVSSTEIGYVDGVTSAIQTQLDSKLTAATAVTSNRNAIINGDFKVWQRGTSFSAVGPGVYTADRWTNSYGAVTSNVTRETDVPSKDFSYSLKFAAPSTFSTTEYVLRTWLETQDVKQFVGKSVTLSFWIKSSKTSIKGRVASYLATGGQDNQSNFTVAANTWTKITYTVTSFSNITAWTTADNANGCFVDVGFANSQSYTSSDYFMVAGIQLEAGTVATPFEFEHYQTTLAKCQRYFVARHGADNNSFFNVNSNNVAGSAFFPVIMRASPTVTIYATNTINSVSLIGGGTGTVGGIVSNSPNGFAALTGTGLTGIGGVQFNFQANAEL